MKALKASLIIHGNIQMKDFFTWLLYVKYTDRHDILYIPRTRHYYCVLQDHINKIRFVIGKAIIGSKIWNSIANPCPKCNTLVYMARRENND